MKKYNKTQVKLAPMLCPQPVVMVSCGDESESNIITAAWTGIVNTNPPMAYVSVMKKRYSHDIMEKHREFVINLANEDLAKVVDYCGVKSGRDVDKWKETGLTKTEADLVKAPMIKESPVNLECKVTEIIELPSHDMFLAEIVAVHIADDYIGDNGAYDFHDMKLLTYNHGSYQKLESKKLGFFGFSIMKPKTMKKKAKEAAGNRRAALRNKRSKRRDNRE